MLQDSRCFIQEHISHADKCFEDKEVCPTSKFPALPSYRNTFNHFAFLTPFPPSYWSYTGTMALILLSWKAKNLCQQLQQKQELFQILSVGF